MGMGHRFLASIVCLSMCSIGWALDLDSQQQFDIPAQKLSTALVEFSRQAKTPIVSSAPDVERFNSPGVTGRMSLKQALRNLLQGTGLEIRTTDNGAIAVGMFGAKPLRESESGANMSSPPPTSPGTSLQTVPEKSSSKDTETQGKNDLDEITVTGTHIRGTTNSPSPVLVFTRDDIDAAGANTIQDLLQSLPQNFDSVSANTILADAGRGTNGINGSAPDLRGLGAGATLVLINGHRVAPGNFDGSFVDISMIPLTAVERIEIVTDG